MIFSAISYFAVHGLSWLIGAWQVRLARFGILAALAFAGVTGLKAYWQHGLIERAKVEAQTARAREQAAREGTSILFSHQVSIEADARAEAKRAAELEEARHASWTPDTVVLPAGDSWLRGKAGGARR